MTNAQQVDDSVSIAYTGHHPPGFTLTRYTDGVILIVADDGVVLDAGSGRILRKELGAISAGPYVVVADLRGSLLSITKPGRSSPTTRADEYWQRR